MIISHPITRKIDDRECGALTVDSDGNALGEHEAVSALEGRDLAELVKLEVLGGDTLRRLGVDELDVEAVLLRDREKRRGARVTLLAAVRWGSRDVYQCREAMRYLPSSCTTFRKT
jgi:hypothetical protein